jgi:transposase
MGTSNYSDEFKRDAVHQITVRGYPVREVSRRLGVSKYSLYKWLKLFGEPSPKQRVDHEAENRRLKRERIRRRTYPTRDAARQNVFEYIELFYNPKRKHTNNGMLSPVDFEIRQQKLTEAGV